jgi:molybdopterin-containing oxidoreductase family iron-sulfur binding subunit
MVTMEGNNNPSKQMQGELVQIRTAAAAGDASAASAQAADAPGYWRSLEELARTPEFEERLHREFPHAAEVWHDDVSRRGFLKLMSASLALAGLTSCTKLPHRGIVPYVRQPEGMTPGLPLFFASAMELAGQAVPVLVRSNEGRPTKVEGNPEHPATMGATDIFAQASVLELFDPERSQTCLYHGEVRPWAGFVGAMQEVIGAQKAVRGAGMRLLTHGVLSPTLASQIRGLQQSFPEMKWHQWEPVNRDAVRAGSILAFGEYVEAQYQLRNADVIVSLDADFLYPGFPGFHRYAREWAERRDPDAAAGMSRMYAIESTVSTTGFKADHRFAVRPSEIESYARALATHLGLAAGGTVRSEHQSSIAEIARDLQKAKGKAVVIPGMGAPASVHALAHAINEALGAQGSTVVYSDPVADGPVDQVQSVRELAAEMQAGKVQTLVIVGGNPVYDAPAEIDLRTAMEKVALKVFLGLSVNETSNHCDWHVNAAHSLEAWSDLRADDGTVSIVQPLIAPLYSGRSVHELLAVFHGQPDASGYDIVRGYWQSQYKGADFEAWWRKAVHDGFMEGTAFPHRKAALRTHDFPATQPVAQGLEINFRPDPTIYDGRFANNGWLQETPKPHTKVTWDNPALISPRTAERLGVHASQDADVVELERKGRKLRVPVWVQPGQPDDCITLMLGSGRIEAGETGTGKGVNAYQLRFSDTPYMAAGVQAKVTGERYKLASRQGYQDIEGRNMIRAATLEEYRKTPGFAHAEEPAPAKDETLPPDYDYPGYAWGMSIDLNRCIGCNACAVACQSENNIAIVGKTQVQMGRHMNWIRIDQYYSGDASNPRSYFEPMMCVHCEKAPCELVCPVNATVHSSEGLNEMVYNRCVGTRYCSNNCPWKVRRFNFLLFQDWTTPQYKLMRNPEVTVRSRGVMEKCSYCVQRITRGRIGAERENRPLRDLEVLTACQQACPTTAIVFGDINNSKARVAEAKKSPRNFAVLEELNTRPRTSWLAAVLNPNPAMPDGAKETKPEHQH